MNSAKDFTAVVPSVSVEDFVYDLPPERIAVHPLADRDRSKLLVADIPSGAVQHRTFCDIADLLPQGALLVMNNTRVITARLLMHKPSGGAAEVLCLSPVAPGPDPAVALQSASPCRWRCMIGGRRIRQGSVLELSVPDIGGGNIALRAEVLDREGTETTVLFTWQPEHLSFAAVLDAAGVLPLPPYLRREAEAEDSQRYQTVYAHEPGSVAAPTAGLHFTEAVLTALHRRGIRIDHVTLHVGAGTFQPLQSDDVTGHRMHREYISVQRATVDTLLAHLRHRAATSPAAAPVVPVGTTSVRTLETLYWFGVRLIADDGDARTADELALDQWDPYRLRSAVAPVAPQQAVEAVRQWMEQRGSDTVTGSTGIMIVPGYTFALCDALVTNFHQPHSTLILLVAALTGRDFWQRIYREALDNDYRFLSYGDSSLLMNLQR